MADAMAGQATMRPLLVGLVDTRLLKGDFAVVRAAARLVVPSAPAQIVSGVYQHSRRTRSLTRLGPVGLALAPVESLRAVQNFDLNPKLRPLGVGRDDPLRSQSARRRNDQGIRKAQPRMPGPERCSNGGDLTIGWYDNGGQRVDERVHDVGRGGIASHRSHEDSAYADAGSANCWPSARARSSRLRASS